jgi:hypothetical protein
MWGLITEAVVPKSHREDSFLAPIYKFFDISDEWTVRARNTLMVRNIIDELKDRSENVRARQVRHLIRK